MASLPPKLQALRRAHTFACFNIRKHIVSPALPLSGSSHRIRGAVDVEQDVEDDFIGDGTHVLPSLIARLLVIMTHDRKITHENFEGYFRRQFTRRVPYKQNPLGHEDDPVQWEDVDMMDKLEMLFHLCEWQFSGAGRLRTMMGEVDDLVWRLEPIGQDSKQNTYWLIGGDRLWVQHPDPNPPPPPPRARRRAANAASSSKAVTNKTGTRTSGGKRPAAKSTGTGRGRGRPPNLAKNATSEKKSKSSARPRGRPRSPSLEAEALITTTRTRSGGRQARTTPSRPMRSAAMTANANMRKRPLPTEYFEDAFNEVEDTSEEQLLMKGSKRARTGTSTPMSSSVPPATRATRSTRNSRLRNQDEDEWQQIPDEWLQSDFPAHHAGDRDDGEFSGADARADENGEGPTDGEDADGQKKTTTRSHPRRIVSPSSSPDPISSSAMAPTTTKRIFGDDDSDLTDLTEDDDGTKKATFNEEAEPEDQYDARKGGEPNDASDMLDEKEADDDSEQDGEETDDGLVDEEYAIRIAASQPKDWVEWEAVCSTLEEWETFPKQFEDSTSMKECALYNILLTISEAVVVQIKEVIRLSQKEEAVTTRKRSTRLLALEKQAEVEATERRRQHDELEAKGRELRHAKREQTRAERAAEREERLRQKELEAALEAQREEEARIAATHPPAGNEEPAITSTGRPSRAATSKTFVGQHTVNGHAVKKKVAARSARDDEWELDCEICGKTGVNVKDSGEITCCDICGKWQHVDCHNRADAEAGRPLRNWSVVNFMCDDCDRPARRPKKSSRSNRSNVDGRPSGTPGPQPAMRTTSRINHRVPVPLPAPVNATYQTSYQSWNSQAPGGMLPSPAPFVSHYQQPPHRAYSSPHTNVSYPSPSVQPPARPMEYAPAPVTAPPYAPPPARYSGQSQSPASSHLGYPPQSAYPGYPAQQPQYSAQPTAPPTHIGSQSGYDPAVPLTPLRMAPSAPPSSMPNYNTGLHQSQTYGSGASYYGSHRSSRSPYPHNGQGSNPSPANQYTSINEPPPPSPIADYPRPNQAWGTGSPQQYPHSPHTNGRPAEYPTLNGQYSQGPQVPAAQYNQYQQQHPHHPHQSSSGPYPPRQQSQSQLPPLERPLPAPGHSGSPAIPSHIPDISRRHHASHSQSPQPHMSTPTSTYGGVQVGSSPTHNGLHGAPPMQPSRILDGSAFANGLPGGGTTATPSGRVDHWTRNAKGALVHMPSAYHNPADVISQPIPPETPKPRKPAHRPPRPPVEPLGPNQHFSGSFRAQPTGSSSTGVPRDDHVFPSAYGRDGSRQHVYQPPPTKPRIPSQPGATASVVEGHQAPDGALDNLAALAEAAQAQPHLVRSTSNSG